MPKLTLTIDYDIPNEWENVVDPNEFMRRTIEIGLKQAGHTAGVDRVANPSTFNSAEASGYDSAYVKSLPPEEAAVWTPATTEAVVDAVRRLRVGGATMTDFKPDHMFIFMTGYEDENDPSLVSVAMLGDLDYVQDESLGFDAVMRAVHMGLLTQVNEDQAVEIHLLGVDDDGEVGIIECSGDLLHAEAHVLHEISAMDEELKELNNGS